MPSFDLIALIIAAGYAGLFAIVFAESGLLIGFFLPGDSLLFTSGYLASQGVLDIRVLVPLCFIAAVTGDAAGYTLGYRLGRRLFQREDSFWFHRKHLVRAEEFFAKHGGKAIVLARFLPIVRTFTPIVAGMGAMSYPRFAVFNVVGALFWAIGVTLAGYWLGSAIPDADQFLLPVVFVIIAISVAPTAVHVLKQQVGSRD